MSRITCCGDFYLPSSSDLHRPGPKPCSQLIAISILVYFLMTRKSYIIDGVRITYELLRDVESASVDCFHVLKCYVFIVLLY
jgi:hypothetical protein